jgi:hypothetical protein
VLGIVQIIAFVFTPCPVRDVHAFLDNDLSTELLLRIYALIQFLFAWINFFRPL